MFEARSFFTLASRYRIDEEESFLRTNERAWNDDRAKEKAGDTISRTYRPAPGDLHQESELARYQNTRQEGRYKLSFIV